MSRWFVDRSPQRGIPAVSLRQLLPEAQFIGCPELEVSGCTADSRRLEPGQVYVAVVGSQHDGHQFVGRALERGAAGVVVERPCPEAGRLQVVVPNTRVALARLCHALAGNPSQRLHVVGVAGRFGKTATALFLKSIFDAAGRRFGMVGPLGWFDGVEYHPAGAAPVRPESLAPMLATMAERRCKGAIIEAGDETLGRRGLDAVQFDAAIALGFQTEHLRETDDDIQPLRSRAARLFRGLTSGGTAVVNADDPHAELLGSVSLHARRVSFSLHRHADVTARIVCLQRGGTQLKLLGFERDVIVSLSLVGSHHATCALAAAAVARARGIGSDAVIAGLEAVRRVPGRLEPVEADQPFGIWVDSARTPAALTVALSCVREASRGQSICVVSAEGHADRTSRVAMVRTAQQQADTVIITTSNPRTDDPERLLSELLASFPHPGHLRIEPDRRKAIELGLELASAGDGVLITGKGRESYQILADRAIPFDDRAIALDWLGNHAHSARRNSA